MKEGKHWDVVSGCISLTGIFDNLFEILGGGKSSSLLMGYMLDT